MGISSYITRQRNKYASDLVSSPRYWSLSALTLSYYNVLKEIAGNHIKGKLLDAGAGGLNGRLFLSKYCSEYVSLDVNNRNSELDIIGDIQDMKAIPDASFDTVYSSAVLEHVPKPWEALSEIYRVLRGGGYAIISVPHLSGLHEEPNDFYRYTPYGMKFLMENAGFKVESIYNTGGLLSFLSHPFSLVFISIFWPIPVVRWIAWWTNKIFIVHPAVFLDKVLRLERRFPANIVIIGKK